MDRNRILELALETLERQKDVVIAEIETVKAQLKGSGSVSVMKSKPSAAIKSKKGITSSAARKAHSERMKKYWAAKKKISTAAKKSTVKRNSKAKAVSRNKKHNTEKK